MRHVLIISAIFAIGSTACGPSIDKDRKDPEVIIITDDSDPGDTDQTNDDPDDPDRPDDPDDPDNNAQPEPTVGEGVFLYWGGGGGGPDHDPDNLAQVFRDAGISTTVSDIIPSSLADDHGVLVLLNPVENVPGDVHDAAQEIVERGGRLVSVVDHSGYGGHEVAHTILETVGSTMTSVGDQRSGSLELVLEEVPGLTDGVSDVRPYYSARIEVGDGMALGQTSDGYVAIGYEKVGIGDVLVIGDASMFGYALDHGDNTQFILNFANLR